MKKNMLCVLACTALLLSGSIPGWSQQFTLTSPDQKLEARISFKDSLSIQLMQNKEVLLPQIQAGMLLSDGQYWGAGGTLTRVDVHKVNDTLYPVVRVKNALIPDQYNDISVAFHSGYTVEFRMYNDAFAYRFVGNLPDSITVKAERCQLAFPSGTEAWMQFSPRWMNSYEHLYAHSSLDQVTSSQTIQLPMLADLGSHGKLLITEANLYDYPGMYFSGNASGGLSAIFPPAVKSERKNNPSHWGWDRDFYPASTFPYLAHTAGSRPFPWRVFALASTDKQLLDNDVVYKLAAKSRIAQTDWIKPGQVAWDWWNDWNITGVNFKAGINTQTYEYYIDFAARNHIPYIIMDEGWYTLGDMTHVVPSIDMPKLVAYGKKKGVGIILWSVWRTLDQQMPAVMQKLEDWGIKGVKVDFMDRDDQAVVDFYWRCAAMAASHHLLVDFHGAHKPTGIMRAYPNVVNFEGVPGLEQDKWTDSLTTPWMAVTLPFIRMFNGPMDYTPGAMRNAQLKDFAPINSNPMSLGTRCQQLAMYVAYDAPLQMLSDNPTAYERNRDCLHFITSVPTTWDQTIPLDGQVGQYLEVARRKGTTYYAAGMTNWSPRDLELNLSFLPAGAYHMVLFRDGVNADRNGTDYRMETRMVRHTDVLRIHLAPGGGFAARFYR